MNSYEESIKYENDRYQRDKVLTQIKKFISSEKLLSLLTFTYYTPSTNVMFAGRFLKNMALSMGLHNVFSRR